jgi:voltage-gated potassium channel
METRPPGGRQSAGRSRVRKPRRLAAAPVRLAELDRRTRRLAVAKAVLTVAFSWVLIVGAYFLLPIGHESSFRALVRLGADIALVGGVFAWQIGRINSSELPELRAVEALGIVIALFLALFSAIYLSLSHEQAATFTQPLDHARALYFTITVFSTVGFGDIAPRTDPSRLIVSAQMLLDLAIIGVVVRVLFNAAKSRVAPGAVAADKSS